MKRKHLEENALNGNNQAAEQKEERVKKWEQTILMVS